MKKINVKNNTYSRDEMLTAISTALNIGAGYGLQKIVDLADGVYEDTAKALQNPQVAEAEKVILRSEICLIALIGASTKNYQQLDLFKDDKQAQAILDTIEVTAPIAKNNDAEAVQ